jgi:putative lipoprotein
MPTLIAIVLSVTVACGSRHKTETAPAAVAPRAPAIQVVKGFAIYGNEVRSFRPCGQDEPLGTIDVSGLLWELYEDLALHLEPYEEVFAIVEGSHLVTSTPRDRSYRVTLVVKRVLYMAQEGFRCNIELDEFYYRAYGNEPFWAAWVSSAGIVFKTPGRDDRVWADLDEKLLDKGLLYTATGPAGGIEIRIIDEPCRDSMSGAYFAYSARVTLDSEEFVGCALKGTGTPQN